MTARNPNATYVCINKGEAVCPNEIAKQSLLFDGDIAPDIPTLSAGFVVLDGVKRNIVQGIKHRNPDGTVNFTELDVI